MKNYTGDIIWAGHDMAPSDRKEYGDDRKTESCVFEEGAHPILARESFFIKDLRYQLQLPSRAGSTVDRIPGET
jgi:hypothetical protein